MGFVAKRAQDCEIKWLLQKKYNSRSEAGKDVGLPVPQLVWMKWLTWISMSGSKDDEHMGALCNKPQPAVAFSSKMVTKPLLVTVTEHKAQTQGFLSYWVSWKITSHLATATYLSCYGKSVPLTSARGGSTEQKRSSTQCRHFFFVKLSSCRRKANKDSGLKKDFLWSARSEFVLGICFTIGVLVFSF